MSRPAPLRGEGRRADLDGLRAVAILLVVVYHVWLGRVSGGVDVFLMLSAFFLTGSFARRVAAGLPLAPVAYWARTFKRLVPVSALVLVGVLVTAYAVYPGSAWPAVWSQTWASLGYVQNWELARGAVDYYARDGALASPLQHYWSLSVQGQVFVLWPLLLVGAAWVVRRFGLPATPVLLGVFGAVFVVSLVFSVVETSVAQELAYFDTRARLWEFALGSLVAVALPYLRVPGWLGASLGWVGLVAIVVCGLVIDVQGGFPGYFALWPTLAAAAVIVGGVASPALGAGRVLGHRAVVRLGRDAYALYLVHWPILITWRLLAERTTPSWLEGLGIVVASLLLARILTALVEDPVRTWSWARDRAGRSAVVVATAAALVVVPLATWQTAEQTRVAEVLDAASPDHPGATVLLPGYRTVQDEPTAQPVPAGPALDHQWASLPEPCTGTFEPDDDELAELCGQLVPDAEPSSTIVVVGDSHSGQYLGALIPVAEREGWELVSVVRGGCSFGLDDHPCSDWNEKVLEYVLDVDPDAVFTVVTAAEPDGPGERVVTGLQTATDVLTAHGIDLLGVRDNPRFSFNVYGCAESQGADADDCRRDVAEVVAPENPAESLRTSEGSLVVDLLDVVCPDDVCAPVVGNVYVYLDHNHLTWDYARTMAPFLEERLQAWHKFG